MDSREPHDILSAFASPTFGKDGSFEVNKPVGSMSISPCGRDVVLASRQGLHVIDLDSPWAPPRHLPHHTPWEVADVQWSPFPARDQWVVSTSNQKALVWNLAMTDRHASVEHYLHAHNRAITDINFSAHHPDILATCAVDSFVHCWDLRHPAQPAVSFCDWYAGATQVKWNRQDGHVIASSHDKFLRIWDDRKGAYPVRSIEAHDTKIYGLDWNRVRENSLLTCSLDHTIKFWDYGADGNKPERVIRTPFPVWRARHTPFGSGILAMPQRGDNNLYLYDRRLEETDETSCCLPVKSFDGHKDQVKEFLWRARGSADEGLDDREFQLVSWGADHILRLHSLSDDVLAKVGYEKGHAVHEKLNITRKNAAYRTFRDDAKKSLARKVDSSPTPFSKAPTTIAFESAKSSGMTLNSRSATIGGWASGGFLTSQLGIQTKVHENRDMDPITWMKGVKIGKKEAPLEQSTTSLATPDFRAAKDWEEFESLGEEVAHVGSKFSKVEFQEIEIQKRFIRVSMRGLWDSREVSTYLDCRIDFPDSYPAEAAPRLLVEKTASLDDATINKLQEDVQTIGEAYVTFHRSSLEALLRYLQGEQSVEEAVAWSQEDPEQSITELPNEDESSSDEEDELGGYVENQTDEFGLGGSGAINPANVNVYMPLSKSCGAVWATNGQLVCFFPPKEENKTSLVSALGLSEREGLARGRKRAFDGFGKINRNSKSRSLISSMGTWNSSESASDSDVSGTERSSSLSSTSSRDLSSKGLRYTSHIFETEGFGLHVVNSDKHLDEMLHSNGSVSVKKTPAAPAKTIVSIHDFKNLLPSKDNLTQDYIHFGHNACGSNAQVAIAHGENDLADVWSLLDMLLSNIVPLRILRKRTGKDKVATYTVIKEPRRQRIRAPNTNGDQWVEDQSTYGHVKWAQHPFGGTGLIKKLYQYYSRIADVQMLAMVSCVLSPKGLYSHFKQSSPRTQGTNDHWSDGKFNLEVATRPYFPSSTVAFSFLKQESKLNETRKPPRGADSSSPSSSAFVEQGKETTLDQTGVESSSDFKTIRWDLNSPGNPDMLSSSPELIRLPQKSSSNLASAFAASLSKPFSFSASASSSPPSAPFPIKRISPIGSLSAKQSQAAVIEEPAGSHLKTTSRREAKSPRNALGFHSEEQTSMKSAMPSTLAKSKRVKIRLKNQDCFELDGYSDLTLLDREGGVPYPGFREAYADMLTYWQHPIMRAEVLKHNDWSDQTSSLKEQDPETLVIGKKSLRMDAVSTKTGVLEVSIHCQKCGLAQRPPTGKKYTTCQRCHVKSTLLKCVLCNEAIRGKASPCLKCGHVMHVECRLLWRQETLLVGDESCATGCGCSCKASEEAVTRWYKQEIQVPSVLRPGPSLEQQKKASVPQLDIDKKWKDIETDLAYESLAKNLGVGRKSIIRPSKSQIWRGRERRGASTGTMDEHRDRNFWLGM